MSATHSTANRCIHSTLCSRLSLTCQQLVVSVRVARANALLTFFEYRRLFGRNHCPAMPIALRVCPLMSVPKIVANVPSSARRALDRSGWEGMGRRLDMSVTVKVARLTSVLSNRRVDHMTMIVQAVSSHVVNPVAWTSQKNRVTMGLDTVSARGT